VFGERCNNVIGDIAETREIERVLADAREGVSRGR
jgi:hypothetical protein